MSESGNKKYFQNFMSKPDIALIKLARPLPKFSGFVRPICLNEKERVKPFCPDESADRGMAVLSTEWSTEELRAPALICHKEPTGLCLPYAGSLWHKGAYSNTMKLSTNESGPG